ncbi:hypothetical protein [Mycobacteroides salmoniphilum]|uniref:Uncharacterized protein n=1 Tax=Mycobacteroides salmoniphilum TaxID=404941 RepID=A0A4R8SDM0_9MYCO|nr:hypothetical protein [Mycobacteroides salmoniphilum]TDZ93519.1 hypothetical protein CCUG60885_03122 [Mycobacteroides salmoniphilum]TEA09302.1 hypothetical protein CCUG60883_00063 [Mycobacteroides salmoniphilum]
MQILHFVVLVATFPLVIYRIWRLWLHPSIPGAAITAFVISLWFWVLSDIEYIWAALPDTLQAFQLAAGTIIVPAASLHAFVLSLTTARESFLRKGIRVITGSALLTLTVVLLISATATIPDGSPYAIGTISNQTPLIAATIITHAYAAAIFAHLILLGLRTADQSPAGKGMRFLTAASVFQLFPVIHGGIWTPLALHLAKPVPPSHYLLFQIAPGLAAPPLFLAAIIWPPWETRRNARRELQLLAPLHRALEAQFPDLGPPTPRGTRASERVYEWTAQIQDGLSLTAQHRNIPLDTTQPPADDTEHAEAIINWLREESAPAISEAWLNPPPTMTGAQWVLALAKAHLHATTAMH